MLCFQKGHLAAFWRKGAQQKGGEFYVVAIGGCYIGSGRWTDEWMTVEEEAVVATEDQDPLDLSSSNLIARVKPFALQEKQYL